MVGIVVFSFALCEFEPNECNRRLAHAAENAVALTRGKTGVRPVVAAQWETAGAMLFPPELVIEKHRVPGRYLDSDEVMAQAAEYFKSLGITEVILVAQPFLQMAKCRSLARREGFKVLRRRIGWIGFYKDSTQWWTRNAIYLLVGAVLQVLFGYPAKKLPWQR